MPNSVEISSYDGGTQKNADHLFLMGEDRSIWILVASHLFQLAHLALEVWKFDSIFWVPDFRGHFEALNNVFRAFHNYTIVEVRVWRKHAYSSDRPFQWAIMCLKRISYVEVTTLRSWCTNLPPTRLLALHLLGLGFWMSRDFVIPFYCKRAFRASL